MDNKHIAARPFAAGRLLAGLSHAYYLQTGWTPKGAPAGPPMPTYKLPKEDAEAIVAYLKTIQ